MFFIKHRSIFFSIVGVITVAAIAAIMVWGLRLSTDFTGGSLAEIQFTGARPTKEAFLAKLTEAKIEDVSIREAGEDRFIIRAPELSKEQLEALNAIVATPAPKTEPKTPAKAAPKADTKAAPASAPSEVNTNPFAGTVARTSTVGPTVGAELYAKALWAIVFVSLCILVYLAVAFRTPRSQKGDKRDGYGVTDVSSWWYGVVAVITLIHDIIVPTGFIAFLGHFSGAEVDTLFITAVLTILGYSVNDTIVIFDRVREKVRALQNQKTNLPSFDTVVGTALTETYGRSINTSLTVLLALIALYFVGPETTRLFSLMLAAGVVAGTYSSIMVSGPLLALIHTWTRKDR
jgi:preprotein translocase subunit SecF